MNNVYDARVVTYAYFPLENFFSSPQCGSHKNKYSVQHKIHSWTKPAIIITEYMYSETIKNTTYMCSDTVLKPHNTLIFKTIKKESNTNETRFINFTVLT
jgi:hypothetical protein